MKMKQGIKLEQLSAGFERGIGALDELRVMQLSDGLRLQSAQNRVQAREYDRLKRKYGEDHPRTLNAAARVELGKDHIRMISAVHAGASSPRPDAGEGWVVDGFVRTANGDPVSDVTVAAYDQQERWYQELGYACTNENGYFAISVGKLSDKPPSPVFIRASKGKNLLPSNEVRLTPASKSSNRVEIIIGETGSKGDCMPPSGGKDETRPPNEAVPGKKKPAKPAKEASAVPAKPVEAATDKPPLAKKPTKKAKETVMTTASGPTGEQKAKTAKDTGEKLKESDTKGPVGGIEKKPPSKGRK